MKPSTIKLISAAIAVTDILPTLGDKVFNTGLPGWFTSAWPFVLLGAYAFDRMGHAILEIYTESEKP